MESVYVVSGYAGKLLPRAYRGADRSFGCIYTGSTDAVLWKNLVLKVVLPLFLCPPAGFVAGALASLFIKKENRIMQIVASAFVAFSHR